MPSPPEINCRSELSPQRSLVNVACRGDVLDGQPERLEERDLRIGAPAVDLPRKNLTDLDMSSESGTG